MNDYSIEVLDDEKGWTVLKNNLSLDDAWYWWRRCWDLKITAVITHPNDEPF